MTTEITDYRVDGLAGWIFFDAHCRFCVAGRRRWGPVFERRGFVWLPLQTPGTAARLGITEEQLLTEMWVLPKDGPPLNGIGSWIELLRHVWWLWPLAILLGLPGIHRVGQAVYRWVARNRYCIARSCRIRPARPQTLRAGDVGLLGIVILAFLILGWHWPAWIFMWTLGIALGQTGKWLTWRDARNTGLATPAGRNLIWFLLWPGLDGRRFFDRTQAVPRPGLQEWLAAAAKFTLGLGLIWLIPPITGRQHELLAGWCAMIGIVLCLHFGFFHLLSLLWRTCGINAPPIMDRPLAATALADFWGRRWNTAFSIPAQRLLFRPLARRHGVAAAHLAVFLASGLLHELVISIPAGTGYGLPTLYFALQGTAVLFEHSQPGRRLGLGRRWRGRLFLLMITAAPLCCLFHPPFIRNVILPMLQAIGATGVAS